MTCRHCGHDLIDCGRSVTSSSGQEWEPYLLCIRCDSADIGADVIDDYLSEVASVSPHHTVTVTDTPDDLPEVA